MFKILLAFFMMVSLGFQAQANLSCATAFKNVKERVAFALSDMNMLEAADVGNVAAIRILHKKGDDLNLRERQTHDEVLNAVIDAINQTADNYNPSDKPDFQSSGPLNTPAHRAALRGHKEALKVLAELGADMNAQNIAGWTPISAAITNMNVESVKVLADWGVDLNIPDIIGRTAIHLAVSKSVEIAEDKKLSDAEKQDGINKIIEIIDVLANKGANINAKDNDGDTVIYLAALQKNKKVFKKLYDLGADLKITNKNGRSILHESKFIEDVKNLELLDGSRANTDTQDGLGFTPFDIAIRSSFSQQTKKEIIGLLVKLGGSVNAKSINGQTPAHLAVLLDYGEVFKALAQAGADMTIKNEHGETPIDIAARDGQTEMVEFLAELGVNGNAQNNFKDTTIDGATQRGQTEMVKALVKLGANIHAKDGFGKAPIHIATIKNDLEMVETLVNLGADVNAKDDLGNTPFQMATQRGQTEMVKALVKLGADVNARNGDGYTPIYAAVRNGEIEMVETLVELGANIHAKGGLGKAPIHVATTKNDLEMIKILAQLGADVNAKDDLGFTPAHLAAIHKKGTTFKALVEAGADVNIKNRTGQTPAEIANQKGIFFIR